MTVNVRFEKALQSANPVHALRQVAHNMLEEGTTRDALLNQFEQTRLQLRAENREADEDTVLDVMDFLTGWCSPT